MALIDSGYDCSDPGCIHIVVAPVGKKASDALCVRVLGALRDVLPVQFKDSVVFPRFMKCGDLPKWAEHHLRWEELSPYKQVLGELMVARCSDKGDLDEVEAALAQWNPVYKRTVCCTKCLLVGPKEQLEGLTEEKKGLHLLGLAEGGPDEAATMDVKTIETVVCDVARCVVDALQQQILAASRQDSVKLFRTQFDMINPSAEEDVK